jgi:hypothetical protein
MTSPTPAFAQAAPAPQDVELEGEILGFRTTTNGINQMNIMGVWVDIPNGASITSASGDLTITQLMDTVNNIPGFDKGPGFIGGTGIVTGTSDDFGNVTAETVFADTAENVLLGTVRQNVNIGTDKSFNVEGTNVLLLPSGPTANSYPTYPKRDWTVLPDGSIVHPLYDARYKGKPLMNAYGFRIKPASIPEGTLVAAEGFYSKKEGKFLAFSIEADAGELVNADTPAVSIQRAQCRQRDANTIDLEVRGAIYNPNVTPETAGATGNVNIFKPALNGVARADYGTQAAVADVNRFGVYDFDARITTTQGCPLKVRAQYNVGGTNYLAAATEVEIRID